MVRLTPYETESGPTGSMGAFGGFASCRATMRATLAAFLLVPLLLGACVSNQAGPRASNEADTTQFSSFGLAEPAEPNDPLESLNRTIFSFNQTVDRFIIRPVVISYVELTPEPVRESVSTLLRNLRLPLSALHSLLQGKVAEAGDTVGRFVTNAVTLWLGDLSKDMPYPNEDAGQTLGVAGLDGGPFLVLPLLGPSNVRDALGRLVDSIIDPVGILIGPAGSIARTAVGGVDTRARLDDHLAELEAGSIDFYATIRSLYTQNREAQIRDGEVDPLHATSPTLTVELDGQFGGDFENSFGDDFASGFIGEDDQEPILLPGDVEFNGQAVVDADIGRNLEDDIDTDPSYDGPAGSDGNLAGVQKKARIDIARLKKSGVDVRLLSDGNEIN